jgi:hypothetical protein
MTEVEPPEGASSRPSGRDLFGLLAGGEGAITGTVVCAAAIAYGASHGATIGGLAAGIMGTVAVYWLAHLHAETLGSSLTARHHPWVAVRHNLRETMPIFGVSVVPLAVLVVSRLLGMEVDTAAWTALYATIALLAGYSYLAGSRAGLDLWGRVMSSVAGAALGILVALLKVWLH